MPTVAAAKRSKKKIIVPKPAEPKQEITKAPDVLADFTQWLDNTMTTVNGKQIALMNSGSTDKKTHQIIIDKILKEQFKRAKWI